MYVYLIGDNGGREIRGGDQQRDLLLLCYLKEEWWCYSERRKF